MRCQKRKSSRGALGSGVGMGALFPIVPMGYQSLPQVVKLQSNSSPDPVSSGKTVCLSIIYLPCLSDTYMCVYVYIYFSEQERRRLLCSHLERGRQVLDRMLVAL